MTTDIRPLYPASDDRLLTVDEVASLLRRPGDKRFVYRLASRGGFLEPASVHCGKLLYFDKATVERLLSPKSP